MLRKRVGELWETFTTWYAEQGEKLDLFDETEVERQRESPWFLMGPMAYLFWIATLVTGFFLMIYYIPTPSRAWNSLGYIQNEVPLGWVFRGVHKYAADAFIIAITMRIYRMYFTAEYRRGKQLTWIVAILLLVFGMFSGLTGYLLQWNQRAYWATKVFGTFPTYLNEPYIPHLNIGRTISSILLGGPAIGPATITRWYSGHYALSLILLILAELHFQRLGCKRLNMSRFAIFITLLIPTAVATIIPSPMGRPADPSTTPERIFSDWYFLALYHTYRIMDPFWATLMTVLLPPIAFAVAFLDRRGTREPLDRPFVFLFGLLCIFYWLGFSILLIMNIADINRNPIQFMTVAAIITIIAALWQVVHSARRPWETRPFPEAMDGVVLTSWFLWGVNVHHLFELVRKGGFARLASFPNDIAMFFVLGATSLILLGLALYDIRRAKKVVSAPERPTVSAEPPSIGLPGRYAMLYLVIFFCIMLIAGFGLIAEF